MKPSRSTNARQDSRTPVRVDGERAGGEAGDAQGNSAELVRQEWIGRHLGWVQPARARLTQDFLSRQEDEVQERDRHTGQICEPNFSAGYHRSQPNKKPPANAAQTM